MKPEYLIVEIAGEEVDRVYDSMISLEVELDDQLASMFRLRLNMLQMEGEWQNLDDERLRPWQPVVISGGVQDDMELLMSGYITQVKPDFGARPEEAALEIWGMDASILMDRTDKLKDWPNKKDSDIATELFQEYGFQAEVETTPVVHDQAISTIIQRETDLSFLKRLALRNGYECYVQHETGYFGPPRVSEDIQPTLAVHFGNETNVSQVQLEVDGLKPAEVGTAQIDRLNKEVVDVLITDSDLPALGSEGAMDLEHPGKSYVGMNGAVSQPEMENLCQGLFRKAEWFVRLQGEVDANCYQSVLMPRRSVAIKGIGESHSGIYYLSHVTHSFSARGYRQRFHARRNGIMPTGAENFSENGLSGLL